MLSKNNKEAVCKVSSFEEPCAVIPHAGICEGCAIPAGGLASMLECFRGSYRRHVVKGLHVNKGDPSVSSGACRI